MINEFSIPVATLLAFAFTACAAASEHIPTLAVTTWQYTEEKSIVLQVVPDIRQATLPGTKGKSAEAHIANGIIYVTSQTMAIDTAHLTTDSLTVRIDHVTNGAYPVLDTVTGASLGVIDTRLKHGQLFSTLQQRPK